jgi:hypothetical protein
METRLIEEITQIQAQLGLDLLGPKSAQALRAASTETLGHHVGLVGVSSRDEVAPV